MSSSLEKYDPESSADNLICEACGTQFTSCDRSEVKTCHICDDPRQYVPPSGQSFTTMSAIQARHRNVFTPLDADSRFVSITTTPRFAISQAAILVKTPGGNVLWDCLTLLDQDTIDTIEGMGGLKAIAISHPHYYSAHVQWARAFKCPVYLASEDMSWTTLTSSHQVAVTKTETEIPGTGVKLIKLGGHFPGSLVALFDNRLLIADTLMTTPSGRGRWDVDAAGEKREKPKGHNSFSFLWSIPNYIPLNADEIARMWGILNQYDFESTHGAFLGMDVYGPNVKGEVLESMKIQLRFMGYADHPLLKEIV